MNKYRVDDIICMFGTFLDDEVEAENQSEAQEIIFNEIMDNLGNYIDIVLEKIEDDENNNEDFEYDSYRENQMAEEFLKEN